MVRKTKEREEKDLRELDDVRIEETELLAGPSKSEIVKKLNENDEREVRITDEVLEFDFNPDPSTLIEFV